MSGLFEKLKEKTTGHGSEASQNQQQQQNRNQSQNQNQNQQQPEEQQFSIQPHPAKTNDPRDLQGGAGFQQDPNVEAFHAHGPYIPNQSNLPPPESSEQLRARSAQLNQK